MYAWILGKLYYLLKIGASAATAGGWPVRIKCLKEFHDSLYKLKVLVPEFEDMSHIRQRHLFTGKVVQSPGSGSDYALALSLSGNPLGTFQFSSLPQEYTLYWARSTGLPLKIDLLSSRVDESLYRSQLGSDSVMVQNGPTKRINMDFKAFPKNCEVVSTPNYIKWHATHTFVNHYIDILVCMRARATGSRRQPWWQVYKRMPCWISERPTKRYLIALGICGRYEISTQHKREDHI